MKLFTQTTKHCINQVLSPGCFQNLPGIIRENTDWDYSYQQKSTGCFLKPTFRNMPYRNSFIPEIEIVVAPNESQTVLHISGQPVKPVRIFMAIWISLLLLTEAFIVILAIISRPDSLFPIFIPLILCLLGYLLCKLSARAIFRSVVKVIKKEFS